MDNVLQVFLPDRNRHIETFLKCRFLGAKEKCITVLDLIVGAFLTYKTAISKSTFE